MRSRSLAPAQVVPNGLLGGLRLPAAAEGVLLGRDPTGSASVIPVFGPDPIGIVYIGGWWAAQVLVSRCLAHGATVVVDAVDGGRDTLTGLSQWLSLARVTSGNQLSPVLTQAESPATRDRPMLVLHDVGPHGAVHTRPTGAWRTSLTVLSRVAAASERVLAGATMALTQRLDAREAATVAATLNLPDGATTALGRLHHEELAICQPGRLDHLWLAPTTVERQLFG